MLMTLFDKFEGKPSASNSNSSNLSIPTISIKLLLMPDNIRSKVQIGYKQTLGHLRAKISEEFKIPLLSFELLGGSN